MFLQVQTNEGEVHKVDVEIARMSHVLKHMLDDIGIGDTNENREPALDLPVIPLSNVEADVWLHVVTWCGHHRKDYDMLLKQSLEEEAQDMLTADRKSPKELEVMSKLPQWDESFLRSLDADHSDVDMDEQQTSGLPRKQENVFRLIMAANFLDMKPLLDMGCKYIANLIRGRSAEQIRQTLGLVNDFTPQEEERIRKENAWAEFKG
jgi:S-phase kinase-associated protein 1